MARATRRSLVTSQLQAWSEQSLPFAAQSLVSFAVHPVPGQNPPLALWSAQPQPKIDASCVSFSVQPEPAQNPPLAS
jgi:hypothetical protein